MSVVVDTNILLDNPNVIENYEVIILSHVLRELEKHKLSSNKDLAFRARRATRKIEEMKVQNKVFIDVFDYKNDLGQKYSDDYEDNKIISACLANGYSLLTNDILMAYKAEGFGVDVLSVEEKEDNGEYTGVKEIFLTNSKEDQELLATLYEHPEKNILNLVQNEYLVIWDKTKPMFDDEGNIKGYKPIDQFRFNGERLIHLKYKNIDNGYMGKVKPINIKQRLLFDLLQNKDITCKAAFGKFGVGKDFLMISHAINMLFQGKIEKIVWIRNNVEVKDSNPIGFLPNSLEDKLKPFLAPLADHLGGFDGLDSFIRDGKVEVQHLGFVRGRDIKNAIVYVTEVQSNTKEHIQLLLGRIGEGSQLWLNGDLRQVDHDKFIANNGVIALQKLKGQKLYGQVTLDKTERSETARMADLLD